MFLGVAAPKRPRTSIRGHQASLKTIRLPGLKYLLLDTGSVVFHDSLPSGNRYDIRFGSRLFNPQQHKLTWVDKEVRKIDGKKFYGTDGEIPRSEIDTFAVEINGHFIPIPRSKYSDLYEPNVKYKYGNESCCGIRADEAKNGQQLIVSIWGSDGAGGYFVTFYFDHNKFLRRTVETDF